MTFCNETMGSEGPRSSARSTVSVLLCCVIGVCVIGFVLNVCMLVYQLRKYLRQTPKDSTTALIVNQFSLDAAACLLGAVCGSFGVSPLVLAGQTGHWLCRLVYGSSVVRMALTGSVANLAVIAVNLRVELRWEKAHRRYVRPWVVWTAAGLCWVDGVLLNNPLTFYSYLEDGECISMNIRASRTAQVIFGSFVVTWRYLIPVGIVAVCYLVIVPIYCGKPSKVEVHHGGELSHHQHHHHTVEEMKTMSLVSLYSLIPWFPTNVIYLVAVVHDYRFDFGGHIDVAIFVGLVIVATAPIVHAECERRYLKRQKKKTKIHPQNNGTTVVEVETAESFTQDSAANDTEVIDL